MTAKVEGAVSGDRGGLFRDFHVGASRKRKFVKKNGNRSFLSLPSLFRRSRTGLRKMLIAFAAISI